jgi:hypothetical protein
MRTIGIFTIAISCMSIFAEEIPLARAVTADSVYLKVIGEFDPKVHDVYFISTLQTTFNEYCQSHIADLIYGFDIATLFLNDFTRYEYNGSDGSMVLTSWCEIMTTFSVPREDDPTTFTVDSASLIVRNFFSDSQLLQLMDQLNKNGNIVVNSIQFFPATSDEVKPLIKDQSNTNKKKSKSQTIIVGISVGIVCLALIALLLSSLRRRLYLGKITYDTTSDCRPDQTPLDTPTRTAPNTSEVNRDTKRKSLVSEESCDTERDSAISASVNETSTAIPECERVDLISKEDPSVQFDSYAAATFDDEESVLSRAEVSPDYQCNSSLPSNNDSPVWSLDSYSHNTSPYSSQLECLPKLHRWHDEVDDVNLLALPESLSPCSSTYHSSSSSTTTNKE